MTLTGETYTASAGETFDIIAMAVYGEEKFAAELLCANPALCRIPVFTGGEIIELPEIDIPTERTGAAALAQAPWKVG